MKVALITDIHFDVRNGSPYFLKRYELFFKNIFFPNLKKQNVKTILILGDTWENRKTINMNSLAEARKMFFDVALKEEINIISILGNHDVFYRNTNDVNSMSIIESAYSNIKVIHEYEEIQFDNTLIGLMSWVNKENYSRNIDRLENSKADIMCGHYDIIGAEMTKGNFAEDGFDPSVFKRFKKVLSGHYHIKSVVNNTIEYLGNPFQTNWDDFNALRGFHILNCKNQKLEFIENTYINYNALIYHNGINIDDFDFNQYKDQNVKVLVDSVSKLNQEQYLKFVDQMLSNVESYTIIEDEQYTSDTKPDRIDIKNTMDMAKDYIKELDLDDDKKHKVINILQTLHGNV